MTSRRLFLLSACAVMMNECLAEQSHAHGASDLLVIRAFAKKNQSSVTCTVSNASARRLEYWTWLCSFDRDWKTNETEVEISTISCTKNYPVVKFLYPGESHQYELDLAYIGFESKKRLRLKLGFIPYMPGKDYIDSYNDSVAVANGAPRSENPLQGPFWRDRKSVG